MHNTDKSLPFFRGRLLVGTVASAVFSMGAHAADSGWVTTHTKAFSPGKTVQTLAFQTEAAAGTPVSITVGLNLRDAAGLDRYLATLGSAGVKPLSHAEVVARFSPTRAQAEAVAAYLRQSGFTRVVISDNRLLIHAQGSAGSVKTAFRTGIKTTVINGVNAIYNTADVQVPAALATTVSGVLGLQTVHTLHTHHKVLAPVATETAKTLAVKPQAIESHNPVAFPALYGAGSTPTASKTTVGIIAAGDISQTLTDLDDFTSRNQLASVSANVITAGDAGNDTEGVGEWNLDSQTIVGTAGGVVGALNFYVATSMSNQDIASAYNKAVQDNKARIINVSLGECEDYVVQDGTRDIVDQIFKTAVAQGQTFAVSTGDSGSDECGDGGVHQSYPAVSPYVVAVGGTTVSSRSGSVWLGETVWNGTGGGVSFTEAKPAWQSGVKLAGKLRSVPDVSFDADPSSGAAILVNGQYQVIGGTSLAAPIFSGIWARLQTANNNALHFPAPALYKLAPSHPEILHDVTSGSNGAFRAATGWDLATGWGSLVIGKLNSLITTTRSNW